MHSHAAQTHGAARVEAALEQLRLGRPVVVDDDRENEGDLICAAETMTAEMMAFIVQHTSGLVCVGMTGERIDALGLPPMIEAADDPRGTAFTVSVDLCTMAGLRPAGVLAEITNADGTMARMPDLVRHRMTRETLVTCTASARVPTEFGDFLAATYGQATSARLDHDLDVTAASERSAS